MVRSFCIKDHRNWPKDEDCGPGLGEIDHYRLLHPVAFTGLKMPLCCENIFAPLLPRPETPEGVDELARAGQAFPGNRHRGPARPRVGLAQDTPQISRDALNLARFWEGEAPAEPQNSSADGSAGASPSRRPTPRITQGHLASGLWALIGSLRIVAAFVRTRLPEGRTLASAAKLRG